MDFRVHFLFPLPCIQDFLNSGVFCLFVYFCSYWIYLGEVLSTLLIFEFHVSIIRVRGLPVAMAELMTGVSWLLSL